MESNLKTNLEDIVLAELSITPADSIIMNIRKEDIIEFVSFYLQYIKIREKTEITPFMEEFLILGIISHLKRKVFWNREKLCYEFTWDEKIEKMIP